MVRVLALTPTYSPRLDVPTQLRVIAHQGMDGASTEGMRGHEINSSRARGAAGAATLLSAGSISSTMTSKARRFWPS